MYTLICSTCNQSFVSNNPATKICKQCKVGHCVICNKSFNRSWPYDQKTCSKSCRLKYLNSDEVRSRAKHNQKCSVESKYGVSNVAMLQSVRDKISCSNQSTAVQSRRKDTCLMRYGTAHPMQNTQIKLKAQRTFLSKYGVTNPSMNAEIKSKISTKLSSDESVANRRHTLFERYGVTSTNDIPGVRDKMIATTLEHYGVPYYVLTEEYRHPVNSNIVSKVNQNVAKLLNAASIATEFEFIISPRSYDIHISEPAKVWSKGKDKITDNLLRQRGYDQLFKTNYGKGTSNEQLMIEHGWRSVYDCGQYVFIKSFE